MQQNEKTMVKNEKRKDYSIGSSGDSVALLVSVRLLYKIDQTKELLCLPLTKLLKS